ncbi:glucose dehydrogenase [FAD, quinone]-like [Trichogramma pretiosum]|uniref:glucose dehydrogenase [FAD, quinone]-like n=1 Tax=Trichogramma pretiosum TaxID=7493 RepID=UPI000C71C4E8|nr:glucose dehydrogenase [FAD, quinone]-like [Trichogramma pretiosum]
MMVNFSEYSSKECSDPFLNGPEVNQRCENLLSHCALYLTLMNTIVQNYTRVTGSNKRITPVKKVLDVYDFIVVGGGNAGAVVAGRLSEIRNLKILLLEAGPDEPNAAQIPSNYAQYLGSELDWRYKTRNETYACLRNKGICLWPRGKNLGGTTVHHGMAYHRGNSKDYEKWVAMGCTGWSWEEVKPYFLKSEDNREIKRVGKQHHSTGGPLPVERFPWQPQFARDILEAGKEIGYGVTEDMVGDKITGFTIAQTITDHGVRISSARSYLSPNRNKNNLHIALNALATKIIFQDKKAVGVQFIQNDIIQEVQFRREIIISGGTVNSPQLLLLSGIGSKTDLKKLDIPVVHDLPGVGRNLHNHVSYGLDFTIQYPNSSGNSFSPTDQYLANQTGPLSSTGLAQVTGILASEYTSPDDPDIQMFFAGFEANCGLNDSSSMRHVQFIPVNLHTESRGEISLLSKDPLEHPFIHSNDLENLRDVKVLISGIRIALSLADSPTMKKLGLTLTSSPLAECADFPFKSDEYWTCAIRQETRTENHQAGSCKMGPATDEMSVVDPRLRVHGIERVRVVDASVMPRVVSGNPSAAITMIAERAVDFIKQDNNLSLNAWCC